MTFSTSEVAVCRSSASQKIAGALPQLIEQPRVLHGDHVWSAGFHQLDLRFGERPHFGAIDEKGANQLIVFEALAPRLKIAHHHI